LAGGDPSGASTRIARFATVAEPGLDACRCRSGSTLTEAAAALAANPRGRDMSAAVEARDALVVLVDDSGDVIRLTDTPALGWVVGAPGAPAVPVINGTLTDTWALCEVHRTWSPTGPIGAPAVSVRASDGWGGPFAVISPTSSQRRDWGSAASGLPTGRCSMLSGRGWETGTPE
jgi:hypothetical protein